jgi:transposase
MGLRPGLGGALDPGCGLWMLQRDEPCHDLAPDWHERRSNVTDIRRLVAQLEHLGHTVILDPAA